MREISTSLPSEARNVFLKTPEGLETPSFRVLHEGDGYDIREYDSYTVAYTEMGSGGEGGGGGGEAGPVLGSPTMTGGAFNTLASYLFGYNEAKASLAMTTPVEIRKEAHHRGGGEVRPLCFLSFLCVLLTVFFVFLSLSTHSFIYVRSAYPPIKTTGLQHAFCRPFPIHHGNRASSYRPQSAFDHHGKGACGSA